MPKALSDEDIRQFRENMRRVAETAFATRGAQGVTLRELAKELGCSAMTPYRYFRDKDEILAMVRAAAFRRFVAHLERAAQASGLRGEASTGPALFDAYVSFALDEPHAYRLMFDLSQPNGAAYPELAAASAQAWSVLTAHFEELVAAGRLEGDPRLIGYAYWSGLHGFAMLALANQLPLAHSEQPCSEPGPAPLTREAVLAQLRSMLWRGAQPQPTSP